MARKREFSPDEALENAMVVFWEHGYANTSIEDIVKRTGVGTKGLYKTFGNKRELFFKALDRYRKMTCELYAGPMEAPDSGFADIEKFFQTLCEFSHSPMGKLGCMACNTTVEMAHADPRAARDVRLYYDRLKAAFCNSLRNAQANGEIPRKADPERQAAYLVAILQSVMLLSRTPSPYTPVEDVVSHALSTIKE